MIVFWSPARRLLADVCYLALTTALWVGSTLIAALGIVLGVVLLAAGGDGVVLFSHLENLSRHYLAASTDARALFDRDAVALFAGLVTLLTLARLPLRIGKVRSVLIRSPSDD